MKKRIAVLLAVLLLLGLAACGSIEARDNFAPLDTGYYGREANYYETEAPAYDGSNDYSYDSSEGLYHSPGSSDGTEKGGEPAEAASGQKLIRKVRLTVETDDYSAFIEALNGKIFELGGYIEDIEANTSGSYPRATVVVRVPASQLSALTDGVSGLGNVTYKHESQQNVTLQYVDTESRIAALRTEQERLLSLLEGAENLSEVLEIEDRLSYVRYELDSYERSLRALANQVDYATATIEVSQVRVFTPTEEVGYWERIREGLSDSVSGLWEFLTDLFSDFVISLPYLLLFLVLPVIVIVILVKRRIRKKKKAREAARQQPQEEPRQVSE